jgi:hypothetical protein
MMTEQPPARTERMRSTHAVTSGVALKWRWWEPAMAEAKLVLPGVPAAVVHKPCPVTASRRKVRKKVLRFDSDIFEQWKFLKYIAVSMATLVAAGVPLMIFNAQTLVSPVAYLKKRLFDRSQLVSPEEQVSAACASSQPDAALLRRLATSSMAEQPTLARRCYHRLQELGLATEADRCAHATLLADLHDFHGARAVLGGHPGPLEHLTTQMRNTWIKVWARSGDFVSAAGALGSMPSC